MLIVLHSQLRGFVSHNHFGPEVSGDSPSRSGTKVQREPGVTQLRNGLKGATVRGL